MANEGLKYRKPPIGWHDAFLKIIAIVVVVLSAVGMWKAVGMLLGGCNE